MKAPDPWTKDWTTPEVPPEFSWWFVLILVVAAAILYWIGM